MLKGRHNEENIEENRILHEKNQHKQNPKTR